MFALTEFPLSNPWQIPAVETVQKIKDPHEPSATPLDPIPDSTPLHSSASAMILSLVRGALVRSRSKDLSSFRWNAVGAVRCHKVLVSGGPFRCTVKGFHF